jgi:hypothetical protein
MQTLKGSIFDVAYLSVWVVASMAGIILVFAVFNSIHAALQASGMTGAALNMSSNGLAAISNWNTLIIFVYVGVSLGTVVSAFAIKEHPIYFFLFLIVQVLVLAITPALQAVYTAIASNSFLAVAVATFPYFAILVTNLPIFVLVLSFLVALAMYAMP